MMYKCKVCESMGSVEHGPSDVRRHLSTHNIGGSQIPYKMYKAQNRVLRIQYNLKLRRYDKQGKMQLVFPDKCVDWIARDCRPLTVLEDQGFGEQISFINTRYRSIIGDVILRRMKKRETSLDAQLLSRMQAGLVIACTSDVWTDEQMNAYLSVTAHFMDC